ncbi:MAG: hypothetical protein HQL50_09360 [Magnetococcales bacterium]|nr:hypothetical protein [Magnetococcales bacterium]
MAEPGHTLTLLGAALDRIVKQIPGVSSRTIVIFVHTAMSSPRTVKELADELDTPSSVILKSATELQRSFGLMTIEMPEGGVGPSARRLDLTAKGRELAAMLDSIQV